VLAPNETFETSESTATISHTGDELFMKKNIEPVRLPHAARIISKNFRVFANSQMKIPINMNFS
jgi:hypothetical protein